jgi:hypothetical protein
VLVDRHPIIGSWRMLVHIPGMGGALTNLVRLSADGGVAAVFPSPAPAAPTAGHKLDFWSTAIGEWEATGENTVRMIFVTLGVDETGAPAGTHTVSATATIAPSRQS